MGQDLTLPEVQPGCIIEYRYTEKIEDNTLYATRWNLQDKLFIRQAKFSLRPYRGRVAGIRGARLRYLVKGLPSNKAVNQHGTLFTLEVENLPALEEEPHMLPEAVLKRWILFYYGREEDETPEQFWARAASDWHKEAEGFIAGSDGVAQEVARVAPAGESPDARLRKLYARVQQIRNLSFEPSTASGDKQREKLKDNQKIADVLQRGYGYRMQLNLLFAGMARAAGLQATLVRVSTRHEDFFAQALMDTDQLPSIVVEVNTGSQTLYLDPGTAFCPYGLLSWEKTGVQALRLNAAGGTFFKTPSPASEESRTERKASLRLGEDGSVEGRLRVSYYGQQALEKRQDAVEIDELGRRKSLQDEVKAWLPASASVELVSAGKWDASEAPLEAEFKVRVPDLAATTGQRVLLPLGVFQTTAAHPFQPTRRVHAVYFPYPYQELDEIEVQLPAGFRADGLPAPQQTSDTSFGSYRRTVTATGNSMSIRRTMSLAGIHYPVEYYPLLRLFFDKLHSGDEDRAVLQAGGAGAAR